MGVWVGERRETGDGWMMVGEAEVRIGEAEVSMLTWCR